jgi:hypothetical protein
MIHRRKNFQRIYRRSAAPAAPHGPAPAAPHGPAPAAPLLVGLDRYSAASANAGLYPELTIKSADLYGECLSSLLDHMSITKEILPISSFECPDSGLQEVARQTFQRWGSDKSTTHNYHIIYAHIIHSLGRSSHVKLLEIGLGTNNPSLVSTMGSGGKPGASVRAFKELLPNAEIFGADVDRAILFQEERLKTFYIDQLNASTFKEASMNTYDIIIDDGLHSVGANMNSLLFALKHVNEGGWIVIEDISLAAIDNWFVVRHVLLSQDIYDAYIIQAAKAFMFVVRRKHSSQEQEK